ncbi:MAG TPA: glycosyltransferase family protein [Longimicrobiales bacterium]|nr:glycosyltransferase family protein [Longimicrobiales bacterium]
MSPISPIRPKGLDVAFVVQGEGRGHMTQALAVRDVLVDAGHRVVAVYLGTSPIHPAPEYFAARMEGTEAMTVPVIRFPAPTLVADGRRRGMSATRTAAYNARRLPAYVAAGLAMRRSLRAHRPDVVVNFFDLVAGFVHAFTWWPAPPPRVALAHAYLMRHPGAGPPPPGAAGRMGLEALSRIAAAGAGAPVALSFDELPDVPGVRVAPPLLRPGLDRVDPEDGGYLLAYALNGGYAREVAEWQARNPAVPVHCYVSGGGEGLGLAPSPGFHLHDLDDEGFLRHLARCRAYAGTAGFESVCEAFYLGKPVLAVPVDGHYEQAFNAADIRRAGVARTGTFQDLDRFWADPPVPPEARVRTFRTWVARAPDILVRAVEEAARTPEP